MALNILAQMAISAGLKGLGYLMGGRGEPTLPEYQEGKERALFSSYVTKELAKQRREALPAIRMEAQRAGMPLGGSYLESISGLEQQLAELRSREIGQFEIGQMSAKREWEQKRALTEYEKQQRNVGRTESFFGTLAAIPTELYAEQRRRETADLNKLFLAYTMSKDLGDTEMLRSATRKIWEAVFKEPYSAPQSALPGFYGPTMDEMMGR